LQDNLFIAKLLVSIFVQAVTQSAKDRHAAIVDCLITPQCDAVFLNTSAGMFIFLGIDASVRRSASLTRRRGWSRWGEVIHADTAIDQMNRERPEWLRMHHFANLSDRGHLRGPIRVKNEKCSSCRTHPNESGNKFPVLAAHAHIMTLPAHATFDQLAFHQGGQTGRVITPAALLPTLH
jgi:hypothetical protein